MTTDFSSETIESRRKRHNILQLMKENCQLGVLHSVKITFWYERDIKIFSEEGKLREFVANRLTLKELLEKGEIKRERKL